MAKNSAPASRPAQSPKAQAPKAPASKKPDAADSSPAASAGAAALSAAAPAFSAPLADPLWPKVEGVAAPEEAAPPVKKEPDLSKDSEDGWLVVTGPARGRWRIGRFFTPEPTRILLADLSVEEEKAIEDDPLLRSSLEYPDE